MQNIKRMFQVPQGIDKYTKKGLKYYIVLPAEGYEVWDFS